MVKLFIKSNSYSFEERNQKRGKVYFIRFRVITVDGVTKEKKLGGFKSKEEAKTAYIEFVHRYCLPVSEREIMYSKTATTNIMNCTVQSLYSEWLTAIPSTIKCATLYQYRVFGENYYFPLIGELHMRELTVDRMRQFINEISKQKNIKTGKPLSGKYIHSIISTFSTFLNWCESNYNIENCLKRIKKPKYVKNISIMQFWTEDDFNKFIAVVDDIQWAAFFTMLFYTGRRLGEVMALQKVNVNYKKNEITFDRTYSRKTVNGEAWIINNTKNSKVGVTPINPKLKKVLQMYQPKDGPFYFGGENPLSEGTIRAKYSRYISKLDGTVKKIRLHDFRHSFVSLLLHKGANLLVVADLIGDTPEQINRTYGHLYRQDKIDAIMSI